MRDLRLNSPIFKKHLASARAFVSDEPFEEIVDFCYLVPDIVEDWHTWRDEYGNLLRLFKNKAIHIYSGDKIRKPGDMFMFSLPIAIARNSRWIMASFGGKQEALWMVGNDGRLRIGLWNNKEWAGPQPALLSGLSVLRVIAKRYIEDEERILRISSINAKFANDINDEVYITPWPSENNILKEKINCLLSIK